MMGAAQANLDTPGAEGNHGDRRAHAKRRSRAPALSLHPLRPLPRRLPGLPESPALGNPGRGERYDEMQDQHLLDCMLCGCCSYVCPSNIPLSQLFAMAKAALRKERPPA